MHARCRIAHESTTGQKRATRGGEEKRGKGQGDGRATDTRSLCDVITPFDGSRPLCLPCAIQPVVSAAAATRSAARMSQRPSAASPSAAVPVTAHSAHPQSKFASMMSPVKVHMNPNQGLQPASVSASVGPTSHSTGGGVGLAVAPPSGASSGGRYTTMLPSELRQPIPASDAPDAKPDAARVYAGMATPSKTTPAGARDGARKAFWAEKLGQTREDGDSEECN